ncbi:hypothetical protein [Streptomyces katsurahamanus]|uniref:Acyl carrier protein n=1 Tax=Streptomyces katsurahamanus TaxID=2577098 RepID=A0ABW9NMW0_9ACTN|nr:hypothetical protein [Streptomyces katsurahamanus]MQS34650.1 hypothetical protein [Streptomyces katsurahamanus]
MDELRKVFMDLFGDRLDGEVPDDEALVFGSGNKYGLESMDTMRFASALLQPFGDKVYDLKVENFTTLRSIHDQLQNG